MMTIMGKLELWILSIFSAEMSRKCNAKKQKQKHDKMKTKTTKNPHEIRLKSSYQGNLPLNQLTEFAGITGE